MREKNPYRWWALLGVSILAFTAFLDATIVNTALPFIQADLKISVLQLQWVANIFTIILSMTMIAIGKLADLWGRKRVFYVGVLIFALGALGAGSSGSVEILIIFRGLQALGASTIFIASAALLSDVFPENERVRAISVYGGVTGFGLMLGPLLGGVLVGLLGWRWAFWVNLPLIALGFAACSFSLGSPPQEKHQVKIDWAGLFFLIFGLGILMYAIVAGAQNDWVLKINWVMLAVGFLSLILLVVLDERRKNPLLDLHVFKEKLIVLSALSCSLAGVVSTVFMFFDPLYLRNLRQLSPFLIGGLISVIPAAQTLISFIFQRAVKKFGVANLLMFSVVAAFIAALLHRTIQENTSLVFLLLPFFLLGINWGLSNSAMITAVNQVIPSRTIAAALGTIATIWNLIGSLVLAISTALFHSVETRSSFLPAFHATIDFIIAFAALILVATLFVRLKLMQKERGKF